MKSSASKTVFNMVLCFVLGLLIAGSALAVQEKTDESLQKKYAPILGTYEFDLSDMGGDVIYLEILIKEGELWGDSGDGMPITLKQEDEGEFAFTAQDEESGALKLVFEEDEEGNYTILTIDLLDMGVQIKGIKQ
jgi:hypothetical protein